MSDDGDSEPTRRLPSSDDTQRLESDPNAPPDPYAGPQPPASPQHQAPDPYAGLEPPVPPQQPAEPAGPYWNVGPSPFGPTGRPGGLPPAPDQWGHGYAYGGYPGQVRTRTSPQRTRTLLVVAAFVAGLLGGAIGTAAVLAFDEDDAGTSSVATDPAPLPADNTSVAAVARRTLPSVVQIKVRAGGEGATGSGFVLDGDGHVITNNHVVEMASEEGVIEVVLQGGGTLDATIVGRSPSYDIAVLEVDPEGLRPAALGDSAPLRVGQPVVAIGSPLGLTSTVTSGIVSAVDRPVTTGAGGANSFISAVQTDAAINPGNSGGPLMNLRSQVIGVNSAIATVGGLSSEAGNIGVGFAIPIDQVKLTAQQLIDNGEAVYPVIGATVNTAPDQGAVIDKVNTDSPAEFAGLEAGDVLVSVDGQEVEDGIELIVEIRQHQPGDQIELGYVRDGEEETVTVTLDAQVG